jgi:hypothetical protein
MAMGNKVTRGSFVHCYDGGRQLFAKSGAWRGYTRGTVSLRRRNWVYVYDKTVSQVPARPAR